MRLCKTSIYGKDLATVAKRYLPKFHEMLKESGAKVNIGIVVEWHNSRIYIRNGRFEMEYCDVCHKCMSGVCENPVPFKKGLKDGKLMSHFETGYLRVLSNYRSPIVSEDLCDAEFDALLYLFALHH